MYSYKQKVDIVLGRRSGRKNSGHSELGLFMGTRDRLHFAACEKFYGV